MDNKYNDDELDFEPVSPLINQEKEEIETLSINDNELPKKNLEKETLVTDNKTPDLASQTLFSSTTYENNSQVEKKEKIKFHFPVKVLPVVAFTLVSILGVYLFINNVRADIIDLIKIEEKQKFGYIDNMGNIVVRPKYLYGSDFYKGYAVVKNYNNLYGMIDSSGDTEIKFGNIFSATLYDDRYIVSKFTNEGLKMGLMDSDLNEVTRFKYDNLSYSKSGVFMYTIDDTMGIMNKSGKELYSYKVDEVDDRNISVEVSTITNDSSSKYAKIKINDSSTIINTQTGKEVYNYTLEDIRVLDNNVFYIKNDEGNNKYFVIKDDKVIFKTDEYKRIRIEDIDSNIAIAIKEDASIDYINLITGQKINVDGNIKYTYSDGVVLQEMYNFSTNKNEYTVLTPKKTLSMFYDVNPVDDKFVNGYMKIITKNNKYSFISKKGKIITNKEYDEISDFNKNGYAMVCNDGLCGVIDTDGKEIISLKYDSIEFLDDDLFNNINDITNQKLFIYSIDNKYGIINSKEKELIKNIYDEFNVVTTKYPIIKAKYNGQDILVNLTTFKDLSINITDETEIYENYIISSGSYYNYNGDLIYTIGG